MTSVYFDASLIVSLFIDDTLTGRAETFIRKSRPTACISDFAAAEFASALGLKARMGFLSAAQADQAFGAFDIWRRQTQAIETGAADVALAERFLRRLELGLRTPDALNLALARRGAEQLATFDSRMAESAERLGIPLAPA